MAYTLIDDWVYIDVDGELGVYGLEELDRNLKSRIKDLDVAFLDYQTRLVSFSDERSLAAKEDFINSVFDESYFLAQERVSDNTFQVIGAKKNRIEEIYRYCTGVHIDKFVPYGLALRAFLKSKGLLDSYPCIAYLDDLRNQTVLTFFEGGCFSSSRKIGMKDTSYMISEIKRSWQNYLLERSSQGQSCDISFVLISNNQEWLSSFVRQGFLLEENTVHMNVPFAVLEGLRQAKFAIRFSPAQEILKQKKSQLWRKRLGTWVLSMILVLCGGLSYMTVQFLDNKVKKQNQIFQKQADFLKVQLNSVYQDRFLSILSQGEPIEYSKVYYDFLKSLPAGYLIDSIGFQEDSKNHWSFQGEVYLENQYVNQEKFKYLSLFSQAKVFSIVLRKALGQRVVLNINQKGAER